MTQVTYHHVSNDEAKAGDYVICHKCGAILKNYAKIGSEVYGLDCVTTILGKKETQVKKEWENAIRWERRDAYTSVIAANFKKAVKNA